MNKLPPIITVLLILMNIPLSIIGSRYITPVYLYWILTAGLNIPAIILVFFMREKNTSNENLSEENVINPALLQALQTHKTILEAIPSIKKIRSQLLPGSKAIENIDDLTSSSIKEISAQLKEKQENEHQLSLWLHNGVEIINIMEEMNILSRKLETESITDITHQFNEIWEKSEGILNSMVTTVDSLYSTQSNNGLTILNQTADQMSQQIQTSSEEMKRLEDIMGTFLKTSRENLSSILNTAGIIRDIAEQIKVISINMRIEAAKLGSVNSGFHVLGQEITKLADRTTETSESTTLQVTRSMEEVRQLEERLRNSFSTFEMDSEKIGEIFMPMKDIMKESFSKIEQIVQDVQTLSHEISHKAKGTMGKLQFSDITGQEMEHRLIMIRDLGEKLKKHLEKLPSLEKEEKEQIRQEYMRQLKELCTTENEINILNKFCRESSDIEIKTDKTLEDEGMLLF